MSIALDLETTGLDPRVERIISVGAVFYAEEEETSTFYRLVDTQGRVSNPKALAVHGIEHGSGTYTWGEAGGIGDQLEAWIRGTNARVLLGHNIFGFDMRFLTQEWGAPRLVKTGTSTYVLSGDLELSVRDTLVWARKLIKPETHKQTRKQADVAKFLFREEVVSTYHNALEDARTCMRISKHPLFYKHLYS